MPEDNLDIRQFTVTPDAGGGAQRCMEQFAENLDAEIYTVNKK